MKYMEREYRLTKKFDFFVMLEVSSTSEGDECFERLTEFIDDIPELAKEKYVTKTPEE